MPDDKIRVAREEATGTTRDETFADHMAETAKKWSSNDKRTYDEFLQESLESVRRNRSIVDKLLSDAQSFDNSVRHNVLSQQTIATQALQNAVETANMVGKQAVRHGDVAIDNQWNPVQQGAGDTLLARSASLDDASLKAIAAIVATKLANS